MPNQQSSSKVICSSQSVPKPRSFPFTHSDFIPMNVVALLPTLSAAGAAVESWRRVLTDNDTLHLITFGDGDARKVAGVDVHYLSLRDRQGGRRLICGVGHRLVTSGVGLWGPYVEEIWPELVWNIRCFDP